MSELSGDGHFSSLAAWRHNIRVRRTDGASSDGVRVLGRDVQDQRVLIWHVIRH